MTKKTWCLPAGSILKTASLSTTARCTGGGGKTCCLLPTQPPSVRSFCSSGKNTNIHNIHTHTHTQKKCPPTPPLLLPLTAKISGLGCRALRFARQICFFSSVQAGVRGEQERTQRCHRPKKAAPALKHGGCSGGDPSARPTVATLCPPAAVGKGSQRTEDIRDGSFRPQKQRVQRHPTAETTLKRKTRLAAKQQKTKTRPSSGKHNLPCFPRKPTGRSTSVNDHGSIDVFKETQDGLNEKASKH